jgi:hypothetical protein
MIAVILLAFVTLNALPRKYLVLAGVFGIIFFLSHETADIGGRWVFPFLNVVGRRILPNAESLEFFASCGMPVSPELLQMTNQYAGGHDRAFFLDPALEQYRVWLYEDGKTCYVQWLLSNPFTSIQRPFQEFNVLLGINDLPSFLFSKQYMPILPRRIEVLLYPRQGPLAIWVLALGIAAVAIWMKVWKINDAWMVAIVTVVLVLPHYFIVWHGDVLGIERHAVPASIQLYLGTWLLFLLSFDQVLILQTTQTR